MAKDPPGKKKRYRGGRKKGSRNKKKFIALAPPEVTKEELTDLYVTSL